MRVGRGGEGRGVSGETLQLMGSSSSSLKVLWWTPGLEGGGRRDGANGRDGDVDERRRYQSQPALLISSRPRCLLTLNDTLVGPMASLRWQHGQSQLLKCKSGFNLKQSRPAEIIFLPSSQVLPSRLSFFSLPPLLLPTYPSFPPPLFPPSSLYSHQVDPWGT